jgi:hypothetical protein
MLATFLKGAKGAAGPAGIQYVGGHAEGFAGTTSNVTIFIDDLLGGLASAPAAGDLVIVYFGTGSSVDRNLVVADYTEIVELYANDIYDANLVVAYKFMGGTPDFSFVLTGGTLNTSDAGAVAVQVWRGVDPATPFDVTQTTATGIDTVRCDPPAITPTTSGAVIVSGGAGAHTRGAPGTYSSSDLTSFISAAGNASVDAVVGLGYHVWTSGSFNPAQFTFAQSDSSLHSWAAVTLALRPA